MHDLVPEHGRKLGFRRQFGEQAPVDRDLAARQRPGIRHRVIEDYELIGQWPVTDRSQLAAYFLDVTREFGVDVIDTALCLLHRRIVLAAEVELLRFADDHEF